MPESRLTKGTDEPEENPDSIGIEGAMKYLGDIQVQLDEVSCLAIAELLQSPSMGEFTREGFLNGWRSTGCVCFFALSTCLYTYLSTYYPSITHRVSNKGEANML